MTVTPVDYDARQVGDLIVVEAPKQPIPDGWGNLTQNSDINPKVMAYRILTENDRDARDVWGKGALVAVFRGVQPVPMGSSAVPTITMTDH